MIQYNITPTIIICYNTIHNKINYNIVYYAIIQYTIIYYNTIDKTIL